MPLTLDPTVGGPASNSYATILETDEFALSTFEPEGLAWVALGSDDEKIPFLVRATRLIDTLVTHRGIRVSVTQARQWPRFDVPHPSFGYYDSVTIPSELKQAQMQLAIWLASRGVTGDDTFGLSGTSTLKSLNVGPIGLVFRDGTKNDGSTYFYDNILPLLQSGNIVRRGSALTR